MVPSPPLDSAELTLIVVESGLYGERASSCRQAVFNEFLPPSIGMLLVLFFDALRALYVRRQRGQPYLLLLSVSIFLFIAITVVRLNVLNILAQAPTNSITSIWSWMSLAALMLSSICPQIIPSQALLQRHILQSCRMSNTL